MRLSFVLRTSVSSVTGFIVYECRRKHAGSTRPTRQVARPAKERGHCPAVDRSMSAHISNDDPRIVAIEDALAPLGWRHFTAEMLARYAIAALDRHWLQEELAPVADLARVQCPLQPASPDDERVEIVMQALDGRRWRGLTTGGVAGQVLRAIESWREQRRWLEIELGWLLDESG
jgi:hypothetical protein